MDLSSARNLIYKPEQQSQEGKESVSLVDKIYLDFENHFRGEASEIKQKLSPYLDYFQSLPPELKSSSVLDIGCGRGEWLDMVSEAGFNAIGVDLNEDMVKVCQGKGYDVRYGDCLKYLEALPDSCLAGMTGFHIVEHLPTQVLLSLITQAQRVLKPGGILVFETPNPENLNVGACTFYVDPTHMNPIPPQTLHFYSKAAGFSRSDILRLHPIKQNVSKIENPDLQMVMDRFYGAQDYALIAYKDKEFSAEDHPSE